MRHEQTIVYQKCLGLMEIAQQAIGQFPGGFAFLADQLRRNTSSAAHNFAEGYYQDSRAQQRRFFGYAIQSAREASTSFDTARAFRAAPEQTIVAGKALALDVVRMLSKFDAGRGRQASETGLRRQATGSRSQAAGNRIQSIRPANDDGEP
jgi:four helix bundle protein